MVKSKTRRLFYNSCIFINNVIWFVLEAEMAFLLAHCLTFVALFMKCLPNNSATNLQSHEAHFLGAQLHVYQEAQFS